MLLAGDIAIRITFSKHIIFRVLAFRLIDYSYRSRSYLMDGPTVLRSQGIRCGTLSRGDEKRPTTATICSKAGYFFGRTHNLGSGAVAWYRESEVAQVGYEGENYASRVFSDLLQARVNSFNLDLSQRHSIEL